MGSKKSERDLSYMKAIGKHIADIEAAIVRFGVDCKKFNDDTVVRNSIAMSLLQIGELSVGLTDEFKAKHENISWIKIKAFRNRVVHEYYGLDLGVAWSIVEDEIPKLKSFVEGITNET